MPLSSIMWVNLHYFPVFLSMSLRSYRQNIDIESGCHEVRISSKSTLTSKVSLNIVRDLLAEKMTLRLSASAVGFIILSKSILGVNGQTAEKLKSEGKL